MQTTLKYLWENEKYPKGEGEGENASPLDCTTIPPRNYWVALLYTDKEKLWQKT